MKKIKLFSAIICLLVHISYPLFVLLYLLIDTVALLFFEKSLEWMDTYKL